MIVITPEQEFEGVLFSSFPPQQRRKKVSNEANSKENPFLKIEIIDKIEKIQIIATRTSIRNLEYLEKTYGIGRWRKMKGICTVKFPNGNVRRVELHWYEAHGIGRRDFKIKRYVR